jgi:hypothetical protein
VKLNELAARLPALYYAALEDGGPSYYVESPPGRGKTSVFRQFPKIMQRIDPTGKYGIVVINGACFTLMTAMGFMVWEKNDKGQMVARFTLPYWWMTTEEKPIDEYDGVLILIDEADKLGMDEKKIVGEAALSKRMGNHTLPPGCVVMFAANGLGDRSGSTRDLDHLINRRITIKVTDDVECTVDYYRSINVLPEIINFAEDNPRLLFEPKPEDQRPYCTPRSLHQVDIHLRSLMASFDTTVIPTDPLTIEEVKGGIGAPAAAQLMATIRLGQQLASFDEVVKAPTSAKVPTAPDGQRLMSYKLADKVNEATAKPVLSYMARFPEEHQVMFVRMATQRNYQLAFQPDFATWCAKKASLIAVLTKYKTQDK